MITRPYRILRLASVFTLAAACAFSSGAALAQEHQEHHADASHSWTYSGEHGPSHWADLSPEFTACGMGKNQTPIDIVNPKIANLPAIQFSYQPSPLKVINNGHSIQVNYAPGSSITVAGKRYELVQFHFHHPSEEAIKGRRDSMDVHLVHKSNDGKLAVVAVQIKEGAANSAITAIWSNLPHEKGKEVAVENVKVNASDLIPANRRYTTFMGSLTTPPCSEGVAWYVLNTPVSFSRTQIEKFAAIYPDNARPVQPLNGRLLQQSK
ncbi:MAG: carbonate dehydratase [Acidobacteria bacterium]|nr:MAG: carbonate dehydratase [Acidobacteriota bacterium]